MNYFSKLFVKAPFDLLQLHMEKVMSCLGKLDELLHIFDEINCSNQMDLLAQKVSEFEHEADLVKNDIRASLPRRILFPVDRGNFLEILSLQDDLADLAEDIAGILTIKPLVIPEKMRNDLLLYKGKVMDTVWEVREIVYSFDGLLEASFGGPFAEVIQGKIDQTAFKEHEADVLHYKLKKILFTEVEGLSTPDFYLWVQLIEDIGKIAHVAEKLALRIGMLLDLK